MTQFLGNGDGLGGNLQPDDYRLRPTSRGILTATERRIDRRFYAGAFWPGRGGFAGDYANDIGIAQGIAWGQPERIGYGASSRVGFIGVARDANGAPLAGVTCSLFHSSDRMWIMDVTSRSDGTFTLQSWFSPDLHFIVFYKAGSPDVFGTTKQTLVGA